MEGESMSEWKEVRLGDIVTVKSGYAYKGKYISNKGKNILLGMGCVSYNDKFLYSGARTYDEDCDKRYCAKAGDIVLATRQQSDSLPILAMPAIIPNSLFDKKIIVGTNLYLIKNDSDIDNHFLFWLLKTPNYVNYISSVKTGTTVRMVTKKDVENYIFKCPSKEERDTISNILWGIDAKIETNNKLNEKLEEMAQAIFKSWFVDFEPFKDKPFHETEIGYIPQIFESSVLGDLCTFKRGKGLLSKDAIFGNVPVIAGGMKPACYHNIANTKAPVVTVSGSGANAGYTQIHNVDVWASDCSFIDSNCENLYYVYCFLSRRPKLLRHSQTGAAQPHVKPADIHRFQVVIPTKDVINEFQQIVKPLFDRIGMNKKENDRLASLRDTLLPRLMSGELIV